MEKKVILQSKLIFILGKIIKELTAESEKHLTTFFKKPVKVRLFTVIDKIKKTSSIPYSNLPPVETDENNDILKIINKLPKSKEAEENEKNTNTNKKVNYIE